MSKELMGAFDFFDHMLAMDFGVSVEVYIETIENTSEFRAESILMGITSEDLEKREQAVRCFHILKSS
ncbi:hypothetical protein [uncultured Salegentibacter sp.]|uniref:hypothetical protein n=1 Tax=uncultured Salegentibacter sp. TaxID=259320 RepID=UPI00259208A7|nr:hypothetical protein [uncultured Salegentibacter sp.]